MSALWPTTGQLRNPVSISNLPTVKDTTVSSQSLELFRLIQRLSRRAGYACVNLLETLAEMFKRSLRATRYALAELIAAGWIERTQTRKGGKSKLFFRPLVRVAGRSRGLFSAPPVAVCSAAYSPVALQVTPSSPIKKTPVGKEDDNRQRVKTDTIPEPESCHVAVSILQKEIPSSLAKELAKEAKGLSEEQVQRVVDLYRERREAIRNVGGFLRAALRGRWTPSAPPSDHPSDNGGRPVRVIVAPAEYRHGLTAEKQAPASPKIPSVASCAPQPGQIAPGRGIGQVRDTIEALKRRG